MIDAGPSLRAAKGLSAAEVLTFLVSRGWTARPSRVDGISILSKAIQGADRAAEFILPLGPEFDEEHRRIADALRTLAQIEGRSEASIADEIREFTSATRSLGTMAVGDRLAIPPEMRAFAEKSVEQAKQAFDGFISAAHNAVSAFEGQAETARKGAKNVSEKAMSFSEQNIASSFAFAQQLVRTKDIQDMLKLQSDYIKTQMEVFSEQAEVLGESAGKGANDTATKRGQLPGRRTGRQSRDAG